MNQAVMGANLAAQRARRYRERKRTGGCYLRIDLDGEDIAALVRAGLLAAERRGDNQAVKGALLGLCTAGYRALKAKDNT
jgi:hypothetical protein